MRSSSGAAPARAIETVRQDWRETDRFVGDALAEICKRILWPENTAPHLAAAIEQFSGDSCSTRTAERYLGGHSEWSGDAQAAIITEILKRKGMRNVRVTKRE